MKNKEHSMFASRRQSQGFTLVEVMIALLVLGAGLLALATMQIVSIRSNAFSSEMTYSTMLAQQRLEILKNLDFNDGDLAAGNHALPQQIIGDKGIPYSVSWIVEDTATDMKTIDLTVQWQSPRLGTAADEAAIMTKIQTIIGH
jgi:type IV pilus modification protein PilV